jgi:hypothetical protein
MPWGCQPGKPKYPLLFPGFPAGRILLTPFAALMASAENPALIFQYYPMLRNLLPTNRHALQL